MEFFSKKQHLEHTFFKIYFAFFLKKYLNFRENDIFLKKCIEFNVLQFLNSRIESVVKSIASKKHGEKRF